MTKGKRAITLRKLERCLKHTKIIDRHLDWILTEFQRIGIYPDHEAKIMYLIQLNVTLEEAIKRQKANV